MFLKSYPSYLEKPIASFHSKFALKVLVCIRFWENKMGGSTPAMEPAQVQETDTLFTFKIRLKTCFEIL